MTTADLQGTWVPDKSSQHWIRAKEDRSRCQIELRADGTFNATVPDYLLRTFDRCAGRVRVGKGRWSLTTTWLETKLRLDFTEVQGERDGWITEKLYVPTGNKLMFWVGDPDSGDRFVFERVSWSIDP
jgi:hypothetical protein